MRTRLAFAALVTLFVAAGALNADAPSISITSPTTGTTLFCSTFPCTQSVSFTATHSSPNLSSIADDFSVTVQEAGDANPTTIFGPLKPFDNNACPNPFPPGLLACNTASTTSGSMTVAWSVPAPGSYTIVVSGRHGGNEGTDSELVAVQQVAVEYPAPPAVANAYINATPELKSQSPKRRGCVISKIAEKHAKDSAYGPKGGPYNESWIQSDVGTFFNQCQ